MATGFEIAKFPGSLDYAKLSQALADGGYVLPAYEQDGGGGVSTRRVPMVSTSRRLAVGHATKLFDYQFFGAVQNTSIWRHTFTTMTMTQGTGTLLMNANSTLTTTTGCLLSTWRQFNFPGNGVVQVEIEANFTAAPLANQNVEIGCFPHVSATASQTDGVYFRYTSAGLVGVINFNGTETTTAVLLTTGQFTNGKTYTFRFDVSNSSVDFWRDNVLLATLAVPAANATPFLQGAQPVSLQFRNPGTVTGSPVMQCKVGSVVVTQRDLQTVKPWADQQCSAGLTAHQGSEGGTIGTSALYSNSLAPGAGAAMTNTTAALGTGFGGQFSALPTLAANTDGILQSYQNPAGSASQPPRTITVRGVRISGVVTTVLVGNATPVIYLFSLAFGHTAVSMATAETGSFVTATAKAPRRIPLGIQTYAAAAALGSQGTDITVKFDAPVPVNPGEFIAVCAKNVGVVTTTGVITFLVTYDAYLE